MISLTARQGIFMRAPCPPVRPSDMTISLSELLQLLELSEVLQLLGPRISFLLMNL